MEMSERFSEVWEVDEVGWWEIGADQGSEGGAGDYEAADDVGAVTSGGFDMPVRGV